ncbi:hypothetical protein ACFMB7_22970 [Bacillus toyonensis]
MQQQILNTMHIIFFIIVPQFSTPLFAGSNCPIGETLLSTLLFHILRLLFRFQEKGIISTFVEVYSVNLKDGDEL